MSEHAPLSKPDIREFGAPKDGVPQASEKRLFFQLMVFSGCKSPETVAERLRQHGCESVVYSDLNHPQGIGLLFLSENPDYFLKEIRPLFTADPFASLCLRPEFTMFGRTYASGHESNLEDWLLEKPRRNVFHPEWPWAVWYPLRRKKEFALLSRQEQGKILGEHALLGRQYGEAGFAADVRLACHGLDANDNEFVIGLVGKELFPLSRLVQEMRKTQQTAHYIESMGPFFVGRVFWKSR